ncbi:N-(5'-phosphoribosyl)anthranilate isomerase [Thalassovita aquimarina]|uniref:N-(5'-phosphoribosyl)anthranilate isomerase n=1 Tax=Thalassovita aquimarina TaxID=2785917 RepID=UPI003562911D
MQGLPDNIALEIWMRAVFSSRDARLGGVIKRQVRDVERIVGREAFLSEVAKRGWQALENGRHFIVCCNVEPIRRVRAAGSPARAAD